MIYVYGASGMLGHYVCAVLRKSGFSYKEGGTALEKDSIVINCAGVIRQRNSEVAKMIDANSLLPYEFSGFRTIHISTDCVFSGNNPPYTKDSPPDPMDPYGWSKALGENPRLSIIRTSFIGEEIRNKLSLLEWCKSKKGQEVEGFTNHIWSGVTALTVARFILKTINNDDYWRGPIHLCTDPISKYDLIRTISKVYNLNLKVKPVLSKPKDLTLTGIKFPRIADQLYELKDFYKHL